MDLFLTSSHHAGWGLTGAGVAPNAHGARLFSHVSYIVPRIIAEQGSSNSGAGTKND